MYEENYPVFTHGRRWQALDKSADSDKRCINLLAGWRQGGGGGDGVRERQNFAPALTVLKLRGPHNSPWYRQ